MAVEQHLSKPAEIRSEKSRMPVAYIGLGILEWHGLHNPAGLDGVKGDAIARHFAQTFGGVVMPPLFWGDNRQEICEIVFQPGMIREASFDHTVSICEHMGYDKRAIEENGRRSLKNGSWRLWEELMVHILFELESFGYLLAVPIPGHYPLYQPLERAICAYREAGGTMDIFPVEDRMFDETGTAGDHAAKFETSLMLALCPDLTDLTRLSEDLSQPNIGVLGEDPRTQASAEFGWAIVSRFDRLLEDKLRSLHLIP